MFNFLKRTEKPVEIHIWGTSPNLFLDAYLQGEKVMRMICLKRDGYIFIGDIVPEPENAKNRFNKGYGSRLMEELLEYAKDNNFVGIEGNLSKEDLDHKDRLHHFYRKFGFIITEYDFPKGYYYGEIHKSIEV